MKTNEDKDINGYKLSRKWFDFCFENPEKISPNHTALYLYIVEHCNRLGWKDKFGLPTTVAMEVIGIKSYNTYKKTLDNLISFGFIEMIEKSKNQYSANIVALSNFDKALDKALDEAIMKNDVCSIKKSESTVQSTIQSTGESICSIYKPLTKEPINGKSKKFDFKNSLLEYGAEEKLADEWMTIRKSKKASNTELAFKNFIAEVKKTGKNINDVLYIVAVKKQWKGFNASWLENENDFNRSNNKNDNTNETDKKSSIVDI